MCDRIIGEIADTLEPRSYTSREFIQEIGKYLKTNSKKKGSLIEMAYDNNVPIFCPAFTDSSAGFGLVMHQERNPKNHITIDAIREFRELTEIKLQSKQSGLLMIGGGVPKNFIQDTVVCAELLGKKVDMHKYAVQITVSCIKFLGTPPPIINNPDPLDLIFISVNSLNSLIESIVI